MIRQLITLIKQNTYYSRSLLITCLLLLFIDGLNLREELKINSSFWHIITNFRIYQVSIELWVMMFASIFAVLGTYLFTRNENAKTLHAQQQLSDKHAFNELTHLQAFEYLFIETIRTYKITANESNNLTEQYIAFPINKDEIPYLSLLKEMNITNNILTAQNVNYYLSNDIIIYRPFSSNEATFQITTSLNPHKSITYINEYFFDTIHHITLNELIGFDINDLTEEFIIDNKESIVIKLSRIQLCYMPIPLIYHNASIKEISEQIIMTQIYIFSLISKIFENYRLFKKNKDISNLIESIKTIENLYIMKYNVPIIYNNLSTITDISILEKTNNFFSSDHNSLVAINTDEFQKFIDIKSQYFN